VEEATASDNKRDLRVATLARSSRVIFRMQSWKVLIQNKLDNEGNWNQQCRRWCTERDLKRDTLRTSRRKGATQECSTGRKSSRSPKRWEQPGVPTKTKTSDHVYPGVESLTQIYGSGDRYQATAEQLYVKDIWRSKLLRYDMDASQWKDTNTGLKQRQDTKYGTCLLLFNMWFGIITNVAWDCQRQPKMRALLHVQNDW